MNTKEIADKLNGIGYREHIPKEIVEDAKVNGIVIVYGVSDDLMEFEGAICDEISCYEGGTFYITPKGLPKNKCNNDLCPYFAEEEEKSATIEAFWCKEEPYSWTYKTTIPHETFEMLEDGEPYCRGIVFNLADVRWFCEE